MSDVSFQPQSAMEAVRRFASAILNQPTDEMTPVSLDLREMVWRLADGLVVKFDRDNYFQRIASPDFSVGIAIHDDWLKWLHESDFKRNGLAVVREGFAACGWGNEFLDHLPYAAPGFHAQLELPSDADLWHDVTTILSGLHAHHHAAGLEITLRRLDRNMRSIQCSIDSKTEYRLRGVSDELEELASQLTAPAMLKWHESGTPQALAARRRHGVPIQGFAHVERSYMRWGAKDTPNPDSIAHARTAAARHNLDFDSLIKMEAPQIVVSKQADIPVTRRFRWDLQNLDGVQEYDALPSDVKRAVRPLLRITENLLAEAPVFAPVAGKKWSSKIFGQGTVLSSNQAETLLKASILRSFKTEFGEINLTGTWLLHRLVKGLSSSGYVSWDGVETVRFCEDVPCGVRLIDPEHHSFGWGAFFGLATLNETGASFRRFRKNDSSQTKTYAHPGIRESNVIAAAVCDMHLWPDFSRDAVALLEGRPADKTVDPQVDLRQLPGPLGRLYRAPAEDRLLMQRFINAQHAEGDEGIHEYESWAWPE